MAEHFSGVGFYLLGAFGFLSGLVCIFLPTGNAVARGEVTEDDFITQTFCSRNKNKMAVVLSQSRQRLPLFMLSLYRLPVGASGLGPNLLLANASI